MPLNFFENLEDDLTSFARDFALDVAGIPLGLDPGVAREFIEETEGGLTPRNVARGFQAAGERQFNGVIIAAEPGFQLHTLRLGPANATLDVLFEIHRWGERNLPIEGEEETRTVVR